MSVLLAYFMLSDESYVGVSESLTEYGTYGAYPDR